jgi:PAS domain S-box-containing protein/MYXO-CTERM domain-containing protein
MSDASARRRARSAAALPLVAAAVAIVLCSLMTTGRTQTLVSEASVILLNVIAAASILRGSRTGDPWRSSRYFAAFWGLLALAAAALFIAELQRRMPEPRSLDVLFLLFLIPVLGAAREEYQGHFPREDRREIAIDATLIAASMAAICYALIRPVGADGTGSLSTGAFVILAATLFAAFGVLALWIPSPAHLLQWVTLSAVSGATLVFGWGWTRGSFEADYPGIVIVFMVAGPMMAAIMAWYPRRADSLPDARTLHLVRPILTSVSVVSACAALVTVATVDDARGLSAVQSAAIIGVLGIGVAARILANQIRSTQAHADARRALGDKEQALVEADHALERVREANETLRQSEEHLRLVFEAAVDGIVELDQRDVILRANDAFCGMVRIDRASIEGLPWTALAASVTGADASFVSLPATGQGTIQRSEGQPLYLESRISEVPMTPPRRLLLVRDVTAGKIADQTIRSLFKFLQDRDEDRTRLLRRSNSAIEAERNRIARDLHDGPVQGVSAASLSLEAALLMIKAGDTERGTEILTKIRKELAEEADGLRGLMSGLRPPLLEERGLIPAIRETLARFGTEYGIRTEFSGTVGAEIPDDLETLAYRVVQEALSNAAKHSHAEHVTVAVELDQVQLRVEIVDDGVGFDSARAREFLQMGRVGLASMRERVELASGTFVVRSNPGRGTTIVATLPVDNTPADRQLSINDAT